MRTPVLSFLLLFLLLLLSITSFSSDPEAAGGQRHHKLHAWRHPQGRRQLCRCEDVFQKIHERRKLQVAKSPASHCPCVRPKHKWKKPGHQKHWRQSCFQFLKQCQLQSILLPL
ncbi:C-X-C motif chemokine 17 [Sarcophilus harrisii]|uniref:C-X-C motif chemokine 17 n=1 Tax=Sarcophilus harrisii TaxID=9305 RepID=UPI000226DEA4|nr:C-X-C motif chemokine 17 [Sarcophilus harrisii]